MISASVGNSWVVVKWAHDVWLLAAIASKNLALCTGGFATRAPFNWNVDKIIPAQ